MRYIVAFFSLFLTIGAIAGVRTTYFNDEMWADSWIFEASSEDTFLHVDPFGSVYHEECATPVDGYAYQVIGEKGFYPHPGIVTMVSVGEYTDVTDISLYAIQCSEFFYGDTEIVLKEVKVGETVFTPANVQIEGISPEMKFQGKGSGRISFTFSMSSRSAAQMLLYSIAVTHYAPNEDRNLAYSKTSATAVLGETFDAPVLEGALQNVEYTSSNPYVAMVKKDGTVIPLASGEATITARAPEDNMYHAGEASYKLTVGYTSTTVGTSDTIYVEEPGELRMAVADLESVKIRELVIKGKLNAADIKYLKEASGRISNLESLDLYDVELVSGDESYGTVTVKIADFVNSGTHYACYISDSTYVEYVGSELNGLGGGNSYYNCYGKGLAGAFNGSELKRVVLPKGTKNVGMYAFAGSNSLVEVEVPECVERIDEYAFNSCSALRSFKMPLAVEELSPYMFSGCVALANIGDISAISKIGEYAFKDCHSLVGDANDLKLKLCSLDSIPDGLFSGCLEISDIEFSNGLSYIGKSAFNGCSNIKSLLFPNTIKRIETSAFADCTSLEAFNCPTSLESVNANSFSGTPWQEQFIKNGKNEILYLGNIALAYIFDESCNDVHLDFREGTISIADNFSCHINYGSYVGSEASKGRIKKITFPSSLRRIGDSAFGTESLYGLKYNANITEINLPENLEEIGDYAFSRCELLKAVSFPSSLKNIGQNAFAYCKSFTTLTLPSTIETIGTYAFRNCESLAKVYYDVPDAKRGNLFFFTTSSGCTADKVVIGANVRVLPNGVFQYAKNLVKVEFEERNEEQKLSLGEYTFACCDNLIKIDLPLGTDSIGEYAFFRCKGLTNVVLPEGVVYINDGAYEECASLKTVEMPSTLQKIGHTAFQNVILDKIVIHATTPPVLSKLVYTGSGRLYPTFSDYSAEVHIPKGTLADYQATDWNNFTLIDDLETGVEDVVGGAPVYAVDYYSLDGRKLSKPQSGITVVRYSDGTTRKLISK